MASKIICILGGSGFVGQHLTSRLVQAGYQVRVPSRRPERCRTLLVLPGVDVIQASLSAKRQLSELVSGCHAVINLVAILNENNRGDFQRIHVGLPHNLVIACREAGVKRLLHMSALNADANRGGSLYLRSKGEGEHVVHDAEDLNVTSFRPSVIYGPDDHFFNLFANLLRTVPVLPLACPESRMAPIYVGDVVTALVSSINNRKSYGQRYDLCGPEIYSLYELVNYTARLLRLKRRIIALGDGASRLQARIMGLLPNSPFSLDNYLSLQTPAVSDKPFPKIFGIKPATLDEVVPLYLGGEDRRGHFDAYRRNTTR